MVRYVIKAAGMVLALALAGVPCRIAKLKRAKRLACLRAPRSVA
jgi:hypothetical protein